MRFGPLLWNNIDAFAGRSKKKADFGYILIFRKEKRIKGGRLRRFDAFRKKWFTSLEQYRRFVVLCNSWDGLF